MEVELLQIDSFTNCSSVSPGKSLCFKGFSNQLSLLQSSVFILMRPSGHIHGHSRPCILLASKTPPASSYSLIPLRKKTKQNCTINIDIPHSFILGPFFPPHTNVLVPSVFSLITCKSVISDLMQITCLKRSNLSLFTEPKYSSV